MTLNGCTLSTTVESETNNDEVVEAVAPTAFPLEDEFGNTLGYATPVRSSVLVAPDHVWQSTQSLYYQNVPIEVLARDFRHDVLFFTVPELEIQSLPLWSDTPAGVGQILTWESGSQIQSALVSAAREDLVIGATTVEKLMTLPTVTEPGDSGQPLYNAEDLKVYGMLIASEALTKKSYFVRSDIILGLAKSYLEPIN